MKIAIASGKGGTGKTTLSSNLAKYLSINKKVVLSDLDVEEPNSGLFLHGNEINSEKKYKMIPKWKDDGCLLCGKCQKVCNFNAVMKMGKTIMVFPELCHGCYACSELCPANCLPMEKKQMGELKEFKMDNLNFVESRLIIGEEQAVPLIAQTIQYIDSKFSDDYIKIFDSPPGTSCPVIEVIKGVDLVLLVTEPTPFGLHDLKLAIDTTIELNKPFGIVINRDGVGNRDVEKFCISKGYDIVAKIPNDKEIAQQYAKGELLFNKFSGVKNALDAVSKYIDKKNREFQQ